MNNKTNFCHLIVEEKNLNAVTQKDKMLHRSNEKNLCISIHSRGRDTQDEHKGCKFMPENSSFALLSLFW